jgi:hypothetical protein
MAVLLETVADLVADPHNPQSIAGRARARRWRELVRRVPDMADLAVVDLGGTVQSWMGLEPHPRRLTVVNLDRDVGPDAELTLPWVTTVVADAAGPLDQLHGERFDLVYSNSLIEHLGGPVARMAFAGNVERLAPRAWVQTPYRYFPVEPHWLFPGFQFLPLAARVAVSRRWPLGHVRSPKVPSAAAVRDVTSVELLTLTELRSLFPDAHVYRERFCGLVKSIVAYRL